MTDRLAVYTVSIGAKFPLAPPPDFRNVDWVVISDNPDLEAKGWQLLQTEPVLSFDHPRSSRHPKMMPHRYLEGWSRSLYIDTNVRLTGDPELLWSHLVGTDKTVLFGAAVQSLHPSLTEEFAAVRSLGLDFPGVIEELFELYLSIYPEALSKPIPWGGILARRHDSKALQDAMEQWFYLILRTSRRDQLSFHMAVSNLSEDSLSLVNLDNRKSMYHRWPSVKARKASSYRQFRFPDAARKVEPYDRGDMLAREIIRLRSAETDALRKLDDVLNSRTMRLARFLQGLIRSD
jgi:hypothetical protein